MAKNILYPTSDELSARERRHQAAKMEEEAKIRGKFGDPESRDHERLRLGQEWEKIQADQKKGMKDDQVWQNHVDRMSRMSNSLKDPSKCERRAQHFDAVGLKSAGLMFRQRAATLKSKIANKAATPKQGVVKSLERFNKEVLGPVWGEPNAEILPPLGGPAADSCSCAKKGKKAVTKKSVKKALFKSMDLSRFVKKG